MALPDQRIDGCCRRKDFSTPPHPVLHYRQTQLGLINYKVALGEAAEGDLDPAIHLGQSCPHCLERDLGGCFNWIAVDTGAVCRHSTE